MGSRASTFASSSLTLTSQGRVRGEGEGEGEGTRVPPNLRKPSHRDDEETDYSIADAQGLSASSGVEQGIRQ